MSRFDKRPSLRHNPRTTLYNDRQYSPLSKMLFSWIETVLEETELPDTQLHEGLSII